MASMIGPPGRGGDGPLSKKQQVAIVPPVSGRGLARRPVRGASRRQPPPDPPGRAAEREVGDRREAVLVLAQREQQVGGPVGARERRVVVGTRTQKQCTRRPPGRTSTAPASPTSHAPSPPRSGTRPVRPWQLARVVADEVAEQPERGPLRPLAGRRRGSTLAPRLAYSSGIAHACTSASAATGASSGSIATSAAAVTSRTGRRGRRCSASTAVPGGAASVRRRALHETAAVAGSGSMAAGAARARARQSTQPPAIGRRRITRSAPAGSTVTCRAWPSPSVTTA